MNQNYAPQPGPLKRRRGGRTALLGCGGLIALVVIIVIIVVTVSAGSGSGKPPAPGSAAGKIGSKVRDGKFQFTITRVTHARKLGDTADGLGAKAQGRFTVLHVTVTNIGDQAQTLDDSAQNVLDARGRQFSASTTADIYGNGGNGGGVFLEQVNPGDSVHGRIYFDLPAGDTAVKAVLHDSELSGGVTVSLRH